jgi:Ca2+-binding EF-hand superfamily protein
MTTEMSELMFQSFDEDNSGSLDFKEISTIGVLDTSDDSNVSIELIFKIFDSNGDNMVNLSELSTILKVFVKLIET